MGQYLIDTNVVSDFLLASLSVVGKQFIKGVIDDTPQISVITQIELLSWKTEPAIEQNVKEFIGDSAILDIDSDIVMKCVQLRRIRKIKTPDAIIAATALAYGFTLITNNESDFTNIKGLKVVNPHTI